MAEIDTHNWTMPVGKHSGELITRVPVSYLKWMVRESHTYAEYAQAELDRRGTVTPDCEISGHAINRASQSAYIMWHYYGSRLPDEGLHAWLCRLVETTLSQEGRRFSGKAEVAGLQVVIEQDGDWPVMVTIMPGKGVDNTRFTFHALLDQNETHNPPADNETRPRPRIPETVHFIGWEDGDNGCTLIKELDGTWTYTEWVGDGPAIEFRFDQLTLEQGLAYGKGAVAIAERDTLSGSQQQDT